MTMLLSPDNIRPNPWQTRLAEDAAHIADLAASIAEVGLLQVPLARLRPHGEFAELAFGHSRLSAFKIAKPGEAFPVEIRDLTDRQMSDLAAEENTRRKNLSAIETAKAIQRRLADFGLGQLEAGAPFGYKSQGAVSNLLRLLKLPDAVQDQVATGELPERLARQMVNVAALAPKELGKLAKDLVKVPAGDREDHVTQGLADILDEKGRELQMAPFEPDWPSIPIALNGDAPEGGPDELRACVGCPHLLKYEMMEWCTLPACFDLKGERFLAEIVEKASKRLGIPTAAPGELPAVVFDGTDYQHIERGRRLLKAKGQAALGLRLVAFDKRSYYGREVLGTEHVAIASVNPDAVEKFLKASASVAPAVAAEAIAAPAGSAKALAAAAKLREQEEEARDARRQQRAAHLRAEHDVVWLIKSASAWIGDQLTISGPVLVYVQEDLSPSRSSEVTEFQDLPGFEDELDDKLDQAKGAEAEKLRRQAFSLAILFNRCFSFGDFKSEKLWPEMVAEVKKLISAEQEPWNRGLGVKAPAGWDKPPVHHTEYNCWTCGRFAGQRKLTKRDQAEGWTEQRKGKELVGVWCPEHKPAPAAVSTIGSKGAKPSTKTPGASTGKLSKSAKLKQLALR